jgi:hypothetical protein
MPPELDELTAVFEKSRQYKDIPREPGRNQKAPSASENV